MSWQNKLLKFMGKRFKKKSEKEAKSGTPWHEVLRKTMEGMTDFVPPNVHYIHYKENINNVPVIWVKPKEKNSEGNVLLWIHGGAFIAGTAMQYKNFVSEIAHSANMLGCVVDYRLAPEHPHPAGLDDCLGVYNGLLEQGFKPNQIIIGGDSAGGNLMIATLLKLKAENISFPAAAIDLSGVHDVSASGESITTHAEREPFFSSDLMPAMAKDYAAGQDLKNPFISPTFGDLEGLPPIYAMVGTEEILYSDMIDFCDRAKKAGVSVTLKIGDDMVHVWPMQFNVIPEARTAIAEIGAFMQGALSVAQHQELKRAA